MGNRSEPSPLLPDPGGLVRAVGRYEGHTGKDLEVLVGKQTRVETREGAGKGSRGGETWEQSGGCCVLESSCHRGGGEGLSRDGTAMEGISLAWALWQVLVMCSCFCENF